MSSCATVTFTFDGKRERFEQLYAAVCDAVRDIALDMGTYIRGSTGVLEFMVDDYAAFEKKIAMSSAKIGVSLVSLNYLLSEKEPIQPPQTTTGSSAPGRV